LDALGLYSHDYVFLVLIVEENVKYLVVERTKMATGKTIAC